MRKNNNFRCVDSDFKRNLQNNRVVDRVGVRRRVVFLLILIFAILTVGVTGISAYADDGGEAETQLSDNITSLLDELDLSELQQYLDENGGFITDFGDNAREIIEYLISGDLGVNYSSYLSEIFSVIFKDVIGLIPAFAAVTAIALLSAVVSAAEGSIMGKSTSKIVRLACYSLIILLVSSTLLGVVSDCLACIGNIKRQIEIITPILLTLTVLTGGAGSAAIFQPSAIFLSNGAVEIVSGFIFPVTIAAVVLNLMSKLNPQMSFSGVTALLKSIMKWVIGITVTVFSIFITAQSSASTLFDGILFKTTKFVVGNSVPMVGNFIASGFDMLTSAGLLIKSSVGLCGIILLLLEVLNPIVVLVSFSLLLKVVGAIVQPIGENTLYNLLSDLSKDVEFFVAGLLTVAFMYALVVMLVVNSANSFI